MQVHLKGFSGMRESVEAIGGGSALPGRKICECDVILAVRGIC
jgi:hypothetical protein